ncbi:EF hand domain-containing protein [Pleurostoma richardsiae]|uniref:EF hand domain-containing protein n=1 Tax=Pleurostoma richardsiae TaxID=41990 RepID=A0AA38VMR9_9PEZI|nr:EF hand domain-containing protein [Pleurostoma richardsiae]
MDMSSSSAAVLTRPRLAILTAAAAISVGIYLLQESRTAHNSSSHGGGLHRSNAIRRRHRSSVGEAHHENRRESNASETTSVESHVDENIDVDRPRTGADGETIVPDENDMGNEWWGENSQRAGQNIVSLLFRVSEDNARRNAYVHRGCMCNACGIVPIRGIRYRCANCADFDLCETCESQGLHIKTHIFYKVRIPAPPFGPRQMQPVWYPGDPDTCLRNLPRAFMSRMSRETGFERPELEAFWEQWTYIANTEWREDPDDLGLAMDRKTFERCLVPSGGHRHTAPNLIHDRMFAFYDTNNDDLIGFTEFLHGLSYRKRKDKLRRIFDGYDVDRDGLVNRRDFLRIFRAYYVLYKQMHKDILEGLDDQVMNSTEAHQLVTSRQPLSSLFGREGRVPQADHRPMEGKLYHGNGDVTVSDDKSGVVNEDKTDTGNREEILSNLFNRTNSQSLFIESTLSPTSDHGRSAEESFTQAYFDALLNTPTRVEELPALLIGTSRESDGLFVDDEEQQGNGEDSDDSHESGSSEEDNEANVEIVSNPDQGPEGGASADADAPRTGSSSRRRASERRTSRAPTENEAHARHLALTARRQRAAMDRKSRAAARKKLHERWKRRQFYLDEEEGASPPEGWEPEEDILGGVNGAAESSKTAQHYTLSPRSRSSSKVRFAEDTDDYEIRSNPSTSSRSVPERWGGMDIPDAERDAGKEILYQVTQQAFNELLDVLFKEKEDLAIRAAETRADRDKHRERFESIDLVEEDRKHDPWAPNLPVEQPTETKPTETNKPVAEQTLEELLASSGYTIDPSHAEAAGETAGEAVGQEHELPELEAIGNILEEARNLEEAREEEPVPEPSPEEEHTEAAATATAAAAVYRDPTMPQFRPNSNADLQKPFNVTVPVSSDSESGPSAAPTPGQKSSRDAKGKKAEKKANGTKRSPSPPTPISHSTLVEWKRLDVAEQEAMAQGGWGRLSYEEFESIYQREETGSNRLDYLGTWIDFCIP